MSDITDERFEAWIHSHKDCLDNGTCRVSSMVAELLYLRAERDRLRRLRRQLLKELAEDA